MKKKKIIRVSGMLLLILAAALIALLGTKGIKGYFREGLYYWGPMGLLVLGGILTWNGFRL